MDVANDVAFYVIFDLLIAASYFISTDDLRRAQVGPEDAARHYTEAIWK